MITIDELQRLTQSLRQKKKKERKLSFSFFFFCDGYWLLVRNGKEECTRLTVGKKERKEHRGMD